MLPNRDDRLHSEPGIDLSNRQLRPIPPAKPILLMLDRRPAQQTHRGRRRPDRLATAASSWCWNLAFAGMEGVEGPLGPFYMLSMRAFLVGKTLVGMRTDIRLRRRLAVRAQDGPVGDRGPTEHSRVGPWPPPP